MHPCLEAKVLDKQMKQKQNHDVTANCLQRRRKVWIAGLILEKTGPVSFRVESLVDSGLLRCHVDQRFPENDVESEAVIPSLLTTQPTIKISKINHLWLMLV